MDMNRENIIRYLGKKVDIVCKDGKCFSGYVSDYSDADNSDIGSESIEISLTDEMLMYELAIDDISEIKVDERYIYIDFWK